MDDQRFDNLSRIIARSTTRRATVKGIAAAIGGGVFASVFGVRAQRAGAQGTGEPGDPCTNPPSIARQGSAMMRTAEPAFAIAKIPASHGADVAVIPKVKVNAAAVRSFVVRTAKAAPAHPTRLAATRPANARKSQVRNVPVMKNAAPAPA